MTQLRERNRRQHGTSLIEMLIALVVLTVGLIGSMAIVGVAIGSNYRSKNDTASAALAEMVAGRISAVPVCKGACGAAATVTVTDCANHAHTINVSGTAAGSGALLTANGNIDYVNQAYAGVPAGYRMQYIVCGVTTGTQTVYDVRWNVKLISSAEAFVVVGAQLVSSDKLKGQLYMPPVNIRTIASNDGN